MLPLLIWLIDIRKLPYVLASLIALAPFIRAVLALGGIVIASLTYRLSNFKLALYGYTVIAISHACFLLLAVTARGPSRR